MMDLPDRVALEVFHRFESLPSKCKPGIDNDGQKLWVPLSGIVLENVSTGELDCVAVATGMKCLPVAKVQSARGLILHDWHAEILAIRTFNVFLLKEAERSESKYLRRRNEPSNGHRFEIKPEFKIHMYCSEAPCGDASMELIMNAQEDPTPWPTSGSAQQSPGTTDDLKGRGYFSELGIVRRKPARGDSPPTLSKSCSDKIALMQITSLLSGPVSLLISPANAYISTLVLPKSQYVAEACHRAFSGNGRLRALQGTFWTDGYAFRPFTLYSTDLEFSYSRRKSGPKSTNISAAWNPHCTETIINGVLQGRKQMDPRGASVASRHTIWHTTAGLVSVECGSLATQVASFETYLAAKTSGMLATRRQVKADVKLLGLSGWVPNVEDDFEINSKSPS